MGQVAQKRFQSLDQIIKYYVRKEVEEGEKSFRQYASDVRDHYLLTVTKDRCMYLDSSHESAATTAVAKKLAPYYGFDIDKKCVLKAQMVTSSVYAMSPGVREECVYALNQLWEDIGVVEAQHDLEDHELAVLLTTELHDAVNSMVKFAFDGLSNDSLEDLDAIDKELVEAEAIIATTRARIASLRNKRAAA